MSPRDKEKSVSGSDSSRDFQPKELLQIFKKGVQFTEELLKENERLRARLVQLEEENRILARNSMEAKDYKELLEQLNLAGRERQELLERFQSVERENQDYQSRHREIEEENNRLANLYIASFQLHSTLEVREVVEKVSEIILNLIGSKEFSLYISNGKRLRPVLSFGKALASLPEIIPGRSAAGKAASEKTVFIAEDTGKAGPLVCIPLLVAGELLGMLIIWSFLPHKQAITDLDRELFNLIGAHAASALHSARLHSEWQGKIDDGFDYYSRVLNS